MSNSSWLCPEEWHPNQRPPDDAGGRWLAATETSPWVWYADEPDELTLYLAQLGDA